MQKVRSDSDLPRKSQHNLDGELPKRLHLFDARHSQVHGQGIGPSSELLEGREPDPAKSASKATDSDSTREESIGAVREGPRFSIERASNDRSSINDPSMDPRRLGQEAKAKAQQGKAENRGGYRVADSETR